MSINIKSTQHIFLFKSAITICKTATVLLIGLSLPMRASYAQPIKIYSTGLDAESNPLPPGFSSDPHYVIISAPAGVQATPFAPYVVNTNGCPIPSAWLADNAASQWVGVQSNYTCSTQDPVGNYDYQTTFDLTGLDPASATITFQYIADNLLSNVLINGKSAGLTLPQSVQNFTTWSGPFEITTNFVPGTNTLDFIVYNSPPGGGNPSGLRVLISGTATNTCTATITTTSLPIDGGSTSGGAIVNCGSNVTVIATPNACYQFVDWTDGGMVVSTSASYTFTASASQSLVADFIPTGYSISPIGATHGAAGGQGAVFVTANGSCGWTATNNVGWISITSINSGTGNGTVTYSVLTNVYLTMRIGTIMVAGQTYTVTQDGAVDSVGDGISDWWRQKYFGGTGTTTNSQSCALCDADGTGQDNLFKFVAGLNPTDPASVFVLTIAPVAGQPTQMELTYNPIMIGFGQTYTVQFRTNLTGGAAYATLTTTSALTTNGSQVSVNDLSATQTNKFYRIDISLP